MFERFSDVTSSISNSTRYLDLLKNEKSKEAAQYFICYEKKPEKDYAQYRVYHKRPINSAYVSSEVDMLKQRVWYSLTLSGNHAMSLDCITDQPEDFRETIYVDLEKPILAWVSHNVPEVFGFK